MQVAWCATSEVNSKIPACQCRQGLQRVDIRKQNRKSVLKVLVWLWDSPAPTAFLGSQLWLHLSFTAVCWFSCVFQQDALIQIITALQSKWEANHWPLCRRMNPLGDTAVLQQRLSWSSLMPNALLWERQGHNWVKRSFSSSGCCTSHQAQIRMSWTDPLPVYTSFVWRQYIKGYSLSWMRWAVSHPDTQDKGEQQHN